MVLPSSISGLLQHRTSSHSATTETFKQFQSWSFPWVWAVFTKSGLYVLFSCNPLVSHLLLPLVLRYCLQQVTCNNSLALQSSMETKYVWGSWRRNQCHASAQISFAWVYLKVNQSQSLPAICFCSRWPAVHVLFLSWGKTQLLHVSCLHSKLLGTESILNTCKRPGITLKLCGGKNPSGKWKGIYEWDFDSKVSQDVYVQNYFSFPRGKNKGKWQSDHKILSEQTLLNSLAYYPLSRGHSFTSALYMVLELDVRLKTVPVTSLSGWFHICDLQKIICPTAATSEVVCN